MTSSPPHDLPTYGRDGGVIRVDLSDNVAVRGVMDGEQPVEDGPDGG